MSRKFNILLFAVLIAIFCAVALAKKSSSSQLAKKKLSHNNGRRLPPHKKHQMNIVHADDDDDKVKSNKKSSKSYKKKFSAKEVVDHKVPYVHQLYDTPDDFCGNWACGPTSTVMALAYYQKIGARPIQVTKLFNHTSDFGFYVSKNWTSSVTGAVFDRTQTDACDRVAYGAYGTATDGGLAYAWRVQELLTKNGLKSKFYDAASIQVIRDALNNGRLVVMSTRLTKGGHLVLAKGYEYDQNGQILFIVNDPYGNRNDPDTYGKKHNGADVRYTWDLLQGDLSAQKPKWMVEILP